MNQIHEIGGCTLNNCDFIDENCFILMVKFTRSQTKKIICAFTHTIDSYVELRCCSLLTLDHTFVIANSTLFLSIRIRIASWWKWCKQKTNLFNEVSLLLQIQIVFKLGGYEMPESLIAAKRVLTLAGIRNAHWSSHSVHSLCLQQS